MNKQEKKKFIKSIIRIVQRDIVDNVHNMPDEWDIDEVNAYIIDKFREDLLGRRKNYFRKLKKEEF